MSDAARPSFGGVEARMNRAESDRDRVGVWVVGIAGGLATTMIAGARIIMAGLSSRNGLITESEVFEHLEVTALEDLVFGGHDIRQVGVYESAYEIYRDNGTISFESLQQVKPELDAISENIRLGTALNCGSAIEGLVPDGLEPETRPLREIVDSIRADISEFREKHQLSRVVIVNLASTEPPLELGEAHESAAGIAAIIDEDRRDEVRASTLYAWAAVEEGHPFLNFTPSNACLPAGVVEAAEANQLPIMGNDGKTGETLVKSALAPMFKYRNLQVMTWQGYNILGDRDGQVLSDEANKASKVSSKDGVLSHILGYPLHTHVAIDYAPSLSDLKTAWDFIHFRGFLDYKMSLQFTWQGCDAILAAPIVLDMLRLLDYSQRSGEKGLMTQLACFFKSPLGVDEHDLHFQFHHLMGYLEERRPKGDSGSSA